MSRVLLYIRQSDTSGAGRDSLSLKSQRLELERAAQRNDWAVAGVITDADEKGWDDTRPGLAELYARCRQGDIQIVAVWSLSRLARSLRIQETTLYELGKLGVDVWSLQEPWVAQPLFRQILGAVAEQQTRDHAAHTRRALHAKAERGIHHGVVPMGYRRPAKDQPLVIDEQPAAIIRAMYEARARGDGPAAIARDLTRRGVTTAAGAMWATSTVMHTLERITYRGAVRAGDRIIEGAHPAIVSLELWHAAQHRHHPGRRSFRQKTVTSWLEGLVEHACGNPMYLISRERTAPYGEFRCRLGGSGVQHALQPSCPYPPRTMRQTRLEPLAWQAVTDALAAILSPAKVIAQARRDYRVVSPTSEALRKTAQDAKKRAVARRSRAEDLYLTGSRDRAWFDREDALVSAEEAAADARLATLPQMPDTTAIEATWQALRDMRDVAASVLVEDRGQILRALGIIVVAPSGIRHPVSGSDAGKVTVRVHAPLRRFFPERPP